MRIPKFSCLSYNETTACRSSIACDDGEAPGVGKRVGVACGPAGSSGGAHRFGGGSASGATLLEPIAFSIHFQDIDLVGDAVEQRAGEVLAGNDRGLFPEGEVGGDDGGADFRGACAGPLVLAVLMTEPTDNMQAVARIVRDGLAQHGSSEEHLATDVAMYCHGVASYLEPGVMDESRRNMRDLSWDEKADITGDWVRRHLGSAAAWSKARSRSLLPRKAETIATCFARTANTSPKALERPSARDLS